MTPLASDSANQLWSVTLIGTLKPRAMEDEAWARVAQRLHENADHLRERMPLTLAASDEASARRQWAEFDDYGVQAVLLHDDGKSHLSIQLQNRNVGPVSRDYAHQALEANRWPAHTKVRAEGQERWTTLSALVGGMLDGATLVPLEKPVATASPEAAAPAALASNVSPAGQSSTEPESGRALFTAALAAPVTPRQSAASQAEPPKVAMTPGERLATSAQAPQLYAGFWLRVVAYLIDGAILFLPAYFVMREAGALNKLILVLGAWLYFALCEASSWHGTPGKWVLGLRVTDLYGQPIGFARATGRYFGKVLSSIIFYVGYMMAGWTERKQCLHDLLAGCCVVRANQL